MNKKVYFENLDGLRAIAALSVVFHHIFTYAKTPNTEFHHTLELILGFNGYGGYYGVLFFFILSGFLISYLLFQEQEFHGSISLKLFYARRILRIWPLYYVSIIVGFYIYPLLDSSHVEKAEFVYYAFFVSNFGNIAYGGSNLGILVPQWTVAVEEQFYLLWPLLFIIRNPQIQLWSFVLISGFSELFYLAQTNTEVSSFHFLSNIRFLSFGGIIAYVAYFKIDWVNQLLSRLGKQIILLVYVIGIGTLFMRETLVALHPGLKYMVEIAPFLFFAFVIMEQNYSNNSMFKLGKFRYLDWLGKRSYGIYLLHMMAIYFTVKGLEWFGSGDFVLTMFLSLLITVAASHLSYHYFESFFLRLKRRFHPNS